MLRYWILLAGFVYINCEIGASTCPELAVDNALGCAETADDDFCTVICDVGHTIFNTTLLEKDIYCYDGVWNITDPISCHAVDCGMPQAPENGVILTPDCPSTTFGSSCNITCNDGYEPAGPSSLECLDDGTWNQPVPLCQDTDACSTDNSPCDLTRSECIDRPAMDHVGTSEPGHICQCLDGFNGIPGHDGSGCYRISIKTVSTSGMEFQVGDGQDYTFKIANGRQIVLGDLRSELDFIVSEQGPIEENSRKIQSLINNEITDLQSFTQTLSNEIVLNDGDIADIQNDMNDAQSSLDDHADAIDDLDDKRKTLSTSIHSSFNSVSNKRDQLSTSISTSFKSVDAKFDNVDATTGNLDSKITSNRNLATSISNDLRTTDSSLTSFKGQVPTLISNAVRVETVRATGQENNIRTSVTNTNTALTNEVNRAKAAEAKFMDQTKVMAGLACVRDPRYYYDGTSCKLKVPVIGFHLDMNGDRTQSGQQGKWIKITNWRTCSGYGCHRTGVSLSSGNFKVTTPGIYGVQSMVRLDSACSGYFRILVAKNGELSAENGIHSINGGPSCSYNTLKVGGFLKMATNDYVSLYIYSSGDSSYRIQSESSFSMAYIGDATIPGFQADMTTNIGGNRNRQVARAFRTSGARPLFHNQNVLNPSTGYVTSSSDGIWLFSANMRMDSAGTGYFRVNLDLDGLVDNNAGYMNIDGNPAANYETLTVAGSVLMNKGQSVRASTEGLSDGYWIIQHESGFGGVQLPFIGSRVSFAADLASTMGINRRGSWYRIGNWRTRIYNLRGRHGMHKFENAFSESDGYFVAPYTGIYFTYANIRFDSHCSGYLRLIISVDDSTSTHNGLSSINSGSACDYFSMNVAGYVYLEAKQTLSVKAYSSGDTSWSAQSESGFGATLVSRTG